MSKKNAAALATVLVAIAGVLSQCPEDPPATPVAQKPPVHASDAGAP